MDTMQFKLTGIAALLPHAETLVNPLSPAKKELSAVTAKKKKTDDDQLAIMQIEWHAGLYYSKAAGVHVPAVNVERMIGDAARLQKRGKDVVRAVTVTPHEIPLIYSGPRDPVKLFANPEFIDVRSVVLGQKRVMRTRPIFHTWGLTFTVAFDPEVLDPADIARFVTDAGQFIGLCDNRPRFGRFTAEVVS